MRACDSRRWCARQTVFEIAETDLKLRGPGEFFGTRQHGEARLLHIANPIRDFDLLEQARREAARSRRTSRRRRKRASACWRSFRSSGSGAISWHPSDKCSGTTDEHR